MPHWKAAPPGENHGSNSNRRAAANLASEDVQAQRAIEQAGGLIVVSSALRQYPKDEGVQVYGCQTLVNIVEAKDHKLLQAVRKATMPDLGHCFRPASSIDPLHHSIDPQESGAVQKQSRLG